MFDFFYCQIDGFPRQKLHFWNYLGKHGIWEGVEIVPIKKMQYLYIYVYTFIVIYYLITICTYMDSVDLRTPGCTMVAHRFLSQDHARDWKWTRIGLVHFLFKALCAIPDPICSNIFAINSWCGWGSDWGYQWTCILLVILHFKGHHFFGIYDFDSYPCRGINGVSTCSVHCSWPSTIYHA